MGSENFLHQVERGRACIAPKLLPNKTRLGGLLTIQVFCSGCK